MADRPEVIDRLRAASAEHQPNREGILARVSASQRTVRRARSTPAWTPMVGVTATLVTALAVGGIAVGWAGADPSGPAAESSPDSSAPVAGEPDGRSPGPSTEPSREADLPLRPEDRYLRSFGVVDSGSNVYWAQNNVTVDTEKPLTQLTVELRIAHTGGVAPTGSWRTLPADDFTVTVHESGPDALVFRWALKEGASVPAGKHIFAGQYNHATGQRNSGLDSYRAQGSGPAGPVTVSGGFR